MCRLNLASAGHGRYPYLWAVWASGACKAGPLAGGAAPEYESKSCEPGQQRGDRDRAGKDEGDLEQRDVLEEDLAHGQPPYAGGTGRGVSPGRGMRGSCASRRRLHAVARETVPLGLGLAEVFCGFLANSCQALGDRAVVLVPEDAGDVADLGVAAAEQDDDLDRKS